MKQWLTAMSILVPVFLIGTKTGPNGCIKRQPATLNLPAYPGGPKPDYRTPEQREWAREQAAREADEAISTLLNK